MNSRFIRSSAGGVAPIVAVLFVVLMGAAGAAVDYTTVANKRDKAQSSLDSAVMTAAVTYLEAGSFNSAETEGRAVYKSNCKDDFCRSSKNPTLVLDSQQILGTVDGVHQTNFLRVLGIPELNYKVNSAVDVGNSGYVDVVVLADISGSMDIPDSTSGIRLMEDNFSPFGRGCAFACHANYERANGAPIAEELGIYMRRDRVRDTIKSVSRDLLREEGIRLALYSFDNQLYKHSDFTDKRRDFRRAVDQIMDQSNTTLINNALDEIADEIGPSGVGSKYDPAIALIFLTDGVESVDPNNPKVLEPEACSPLKEMGWSITVINIEYPITETLSSPSRNGPEDKYLRRNKNQIPKNLRACASDNQYYDGKFGNELASAIRDAFEGIEKPPAQPYFVR